MGTTLTNDPRPLPTEIVNFRQGIRVAVVGAGVSGICAGAHLLRQGASVVIFERSDVSSGVWNFSPRTDTNGVKYPSQPASVGDYEATNPGQFLPQAKEGYNHGIDQHPLRASDEGALRAAFAPPGPAYIGLKNNVPTSILYSSLKPWPPGTEDIVTHQEVSRYLQDLSAETGVDHVTFLNTRVEEARKSVDGRKWNIRTITLQAKNAAPRILERSWEFDALVVCSGHYNVPRVPDTPGLPQWKQHFDDRIIHTKEYRSPELFRDSNVLVIGGGISSLDVCKELSVVANRVVQSTRGGKFDHTTIILPESVRRVGEVARFVLDDAYVKRNNNSAFPIPGQVVLKDGEVLSDIHYVIVATGYITSFPFLRQYHDDSLHPDDATHEVLVTADGDMVHNLHKDIFYIEDPSLSFVGLPYHVSTFSLFDLQAQAVARVLTGKSQLPPRQLLRHEYGEKLRRKGRGRGIHSLAEEGAEVAYIQNLVDSVNINAVDSGEETMKGPTQEWIETHRAEKERKRLFRQGDLQGLVSPTEFRAQHKL